MKFWKSDSRLDRVSFWLIIICLLLIKIPIMALQHTDGGRYADIMLAIFLTLAVAARCRDAGWPGWIGATVMLFFTLILPVGLVSYIKYGPSGFGMDQRLINSVTDTAQQMYWFGAVAVILVCGCVPSRKPEPASST